MTAQTDTRTVLASRLRRLRVARGFSLEALAAEMGGVVTKQALSKYEHSRAMPTPRVLTTLARALGVKAMSLVTPARVTIEIVAFRKTSGLGRKESARVEGLAETMLEQRVRLQELTGEGDGSDVPVRGLRTASLESSETAAAAIRERWGLGRDPLANVTEALEEHHVHVLEIEAGARFDGLAVVARRPNGGVAGAAVVSRRGVPGERQRFNLAHELGHLVLDLPGGVDAEKAAHRFAGAFLAPVAALQRDVGRKRNTVSIDELRLLKRRYGISLQALVYRLRDLGVITDNHAAALWAEINARGWKMHEPDEMEPERPSWALRATLRALAEGLISAEEAGLTPGAPAMALAPVTQRPAFLRLPLAERRRLLEAQAERLRAHYEESSDWRDLTAGGAPDAR
ncbi:MAG: XRE family transcriptional regulator [Thermoanaerobaculaceae bacterium]